MLVGGLLGLAAALVGVQIDALGPFQGLSIALVIAAGVVAVDWRDRVRFTAVRITGLDQAFIAFFILSSAIEALNADALEHRPFYGVTITILLGYAASWPARMVIKDADSLVPFLRGITVPSLLVSALAIGQLLNLTGVNEFLLAFTNSTGLENRLNDGWDIRGTSTIGHWTALGGYLACIVAACCIDLMLSRRGGRLQRWPIIVLGVALAGQLTTLTFATIALTVVILFVTLLRLRIRPSLVFVAIVVGVGGWLVLGQGIADRIADQSGESAYAIGEYSWLPQTIGYRVNVWVTETIPAIVERPWTGWGAEVYSAGVKGWPITPGSLLWSSPESEWMRTLISYGWPVLVLEAVVILTAIAAVVRTRADLTWDAVLPMLALIIGLIVIASIHSHFSNPGVPLILWPLVFALLACRSHAPARQPSVRRPPVGQLR